MANKAKYRPLSPEDVDLVAACKKHRAELRMSLPRIRAEIHELTDAKLAAKFETTVFEVQRIEVDL